MGWHAIFHEQKVNAETTKSELILVGDSIIKGLLRYQDGWRTLSSFKPLNLGITGDKMQHVLWRCKQIKLPPSVRFVAVMCGVNNIGNDRPEDIAKCIIEIGLSLIKKNEKMKVLIFGILPRDKNRNSIRRFDIAECNAILKNLCEARGENIIFISHDQNEWLE